MCKHGIYAMQGRGMMEVVAWAGTKTGINSQKTKATYRAYQLRDSFARAHSR